MVNLSLVEVFVPFYPSHQKHGPLHKFACYPCAETMFISPPNFSVCAAEMSPISYLNLQSFELDFPTLRQHHVIFFQSLSINYTLADWSQSTCTSISLQLR